MGFFDRFFGKEGPPGGDAAGLEEQAFAALQRGEVDRAIEQFDKARSLLEQDGDPGKLTAVLHNLAMLLSQRGQIALAMEHWQRALALQEQGKVAMPQRLPLIAMMTQALSGTGQDEQAVALWQRALADSASHIDDRMAVYRAMIWWRWRQDDRDGAHQYARTMLGEAARVHDWYGVFAALWHIGDKNLAEPAEAMSCLAQAFWLVNQYSVAIPVEESIDVALTLLDRVDQASSSAQVFAIMAMLIVQVRGQSHPRRQEFSAMVMRAALRCALARGVPEDQAINEILQSGGEAATRFESELAGFITPSGWLFERTQIPGRGPA